jgi:hypothetical protein
LGGVRSWEVCVQGLRDGRDSGFVSAEADDWEEVDGWVQFYLGGDIALAVPMGQVVLVRPEGGPGGGVEVPDSPEGIEAGAR